MIPTQVLQEFHSAATRKLGIEPLQARQHLRDFRDFDIVQVTPVIIEEFAVFEGNSVNVATGWLVA